VGTATNRGRVQLRAVDFAKVLEELAGSESIAEDAASCGTDLGGYVTTEGPGLSSFALSDGLVYHTYSTYAPESNFMVSSANYSSERRRGRTRTSRRAVTTSYETA
jgi:hypothetical protein